MLCHDKSLTPICRFCSSPICGFCLFCDGYTKEEFEQKKSNYDAYCKFLHKEINESNEQDCDYFTCFNTVK